MFKSFALNLASLSKCTERKVSAIITDKDLTQIYSIGINGGPKGGADCLCVTEGKGGCIHAEINALNKCTNSDTDKIMFITLSPCKQCAAAITNAPGSFCTIFYTDQWKDTSGIKILNDAGINVVKI